VPAGLDGNPNPVTSARRSAVLDRLASEIDSRRGPGVLRVAVDGIDGAGKSTHADELATVLGGRGIPVIRSTTDAFHHPRAVRGARGKASPEGFYRDSHDLATLSLLLLDPVSAAPPQPYRAAAFDEPSDSPVDAPVEHPVSGSVLLFDGLFLQRRELCGYWDYAIYVDGERRVREGRLALAAADCPPGPDVLWHLIRWWSVLARYVDGQRLYLSECDPRSRADAVVANNDLIAPRLTLREPTDEGGQRRT
jgi:uridine kinase